MRAHILKHSMAALAVCAALGLTGCKPDQSMTNEMREQEVTMSAEASDWQRDVTSWRGQHEELLAWYGVMRDTRDSAVAGERINDLNEHAENVSVFQSSLEEHETALAAEHQRPERDRVMAHAELWAEHQRLKVSYSMLSDTHAELMKAYTELRGKKA